MGGAHRFGAVVVIAMAGCAGSVAIEHGAATSGGTGGGGGSGTGGASAEYSAFALATDIPRWVVFKRETTADRCVRIIVAEEQGPGIGISTNPGWTTERVEITDHAADCALGPDGAPATPLGQVAEAKNGSGSLTIGCSVDVHVTLSFAAGQAWVPAEEQLDASIPMVAPAGTGVPIPC